MGDTEAVAPTAPSGPDRRWYAEDAQAALTEFDSDAESGLTASEAADRLARYGLNEIAGEKPPSVWAIAVEQLRNPMNIMLMAVVVVSLVISQFSTALIVGLLILLNVNLGTRQELKARESVDALSKMQVPQAKVVRGGVLSLVPAVELVPGDVVQLEAGDIVRPTGAFCARPRSRPRRPPSPGRAHRSPRTRRPSRPGRWRSAIGPTWSSKAPRSPAARRRWSSPPPACTPRWAGSPGC
jgi:hypothetical protein